MNDQFCIEFSGGKDSTALLFKLLEKGTHIDKVIRVDFGIEYPEMYKHIAEVETQAKKCQPDIEFLTLDLKKVWIEKLKTDGYPSALIRWCTREKVNAIKRETKNSVVAVGIAYDEIERCFTDGSKIRKHIFPLVEMRLTEKDCLDYCFSLGFTFYGLYDKRKRVSCFACPFMVNDQVLIMPDDLAKRIAEFESICNPRYRTTCFKNETFAERRKRLQEKT